MSLDKFQMIANCYGGSNVLHMLILHSKCSINVPISCVQPGTCRNIWNVPNLLSAGKWQVLPTRACNVLKMYLLVSRPPRPQWAHVGMLFSSKTGKQRDPLCEQSDAEVGREALTSGVEFFLAEGSCNPGYEVFHNSLVQLMEDIGG